MYIVTFPDGTFKQAYTRRDATSKVRRWNAKNPENKTCSLYSVRPLNLYVESPSISFGKSLIKRILSHLFGGFYE